MKRRQLLKKLLSFLPLAAGYIGAVSRLAFARQTLGDAEQEEVAYGMGIQVDQCIGCNRCTQACKAENDLSEEPFYVRTWVERYTIDSDNNVSVAVIGSTTRSGREAAAPESNVLRSFFVPKLCNHCANPPCVQVCPVEATFSTADEIVLIDKERCIGCGYCIQACPYGARYLHPETHTADKCTFCYHRIKQGLLPACVEVCPTRGRVFGDLKGRASPLIRLRRMSKIHVLKPYLNTEPKVFYTGLDGEVN